MTFIDVRLGVFNLIESNIDLSGELENSFCFRKITAPRALNTFE